MNIPRHYQLGCVCAESDHITPLFPHKLCISVIPVMLSLFFCLTHTFPYFSSYSPSSLHCCIPTSALKLYLAGRKGLVLHGDSAVGSQHCDAQLLLSVQGLLVPLLHRYRLKGRDHCHLEVKRKGWGNKGGKLSAEWLTFDRQHFQSILSICGAVSNLLTLDLHMLKYVFII